MTNPQENPLHTNVSPGVQPPVNQGVEQGVHQGTVPPVTQDTPEVSNKGGIKLPPALESKPRWMLIAGAAVVALILIAAIAFAALQLFGPDSVGFGARRNAAAVVNREVISVEDLDREIERISIGNPGIFDSDETEIGQIREMVLTEMIDRTLLEQAARSEGITVESSEVEEQLEQLKESFGSEEAFQQGLEDFALSESELEEQLHSGLLIQGLFEKISGEEGMDNEAYLVLIERLREEATIEILDPQILEFQESLDPESDGVEALPEHDDDEVGEYVGDDLVQD